LARTLLGSTGCQPVVAGSPAGNIFARAIGVVARFPVSASCRDLQASSLRSPEVPPAKGPRINFVTKSLQIILDKILIPD
jgi:hypothetical protein